MNKYNEHTQLARRRSSWFKRLNAEYKYNTGTTFFITLTYEDSYLPCEFDEYGNLEGVKASKRDVQLFMKKVRRYYGERLGSVRYFLVSEFGEQTDRPHYHMLLFTERKCTRAFMYDVLFKCWRKGYILDAQYLRGPQGIRYVCKYIGKQFGDCRTFCLMSRRPGLGYSYVRKMQKYHRQDTDDSVCYGCRFLKFELLQSQQCPFVTCLETCPTLRKQVDKLRERDFYVLAMTNIEASRKRRPSLPRFFREKLYTKNERTLMFNLKLMEDDEFIKSLPVAQRICEQAKRVAQAEVREMVCRRRDNDFYRRSRPVYSNKPK